MGKQGKGKLKKEVKRVKQKDKGSQPNRLGQLSLGQARLGKLNLFKTAYYQMNKTNFKKERQRDRTDRQMLISDK